MASIDGPEPPCTAETCIFFASLRNLLATYAQQWSQASFRRYRFTERKPGESWDHCPIPGCRRNIKQNEDVTDISLPSSHPILLVHTQCLEWYTRLVARSDLENDDRSLYRREILFNLKRTLPSGKDVVISIDSLSFQEKPTHGLVTVHSGTSIPIISTPEDEDSPRNLDDLLTDIPEASDGIHTASPICSIIPPPRRQDMLSLPTPIGTPLSDDARWVTELTSPDTMTALESISKPLPQYPLRARSLSAHKPSRWAQAFSDLKKLE